MTQLEYARQGDITKEMHEVAEDEGLSPEFIRDQVAAGTVVIPKNILHDFRAIGVGEGLRTKVNANIGTSSDHVDLDEEIRKLRVAIQYGADGVMDLSTGGDLREVRRALLRECSVMMGSVPIYEAATRLQQERRLIEHMTADDLFWAIQRHCEDGVDFITVHCGVTQQSVKHYYRDGRITGIVSRGGSLLAAWMLYTGQESPLYAQYDRLLEIARKYDATLSLGDGLRPGATGDASDACQFAELLVLGELADRARAAGVQVMIEGPGHVPLNQIEANVILEKRICKGAPFYVLGPLTCDVAPGYDHITGAIGGAIASGAGVDFLCYVTPAEHLRLPTVEDVKDGVIATRIAAHSGDLVKGVKSAKAWDDEMSRRRKALDWEGQFELALDPEKARRYRIDSEDYDKKVCTMCGALCSMHITNVAERTFEREGLEHEHQLVH